MKALSVRQPWATLICAGIKDVENRTWKAAKVPGKILIHASSRKIPQNFLETLSVHQNSIINNHILMGNLAPMGDLYPTSAIIGYCTITGFEDDTDSLWDDGPGVIKWTIEDAWMFDKPILNVKGKLNLFDYDEIDENTLPPAHKVPLFNIHMEGNKVVLPVLDGVIEDVIDKKTTDWEYFVVEGMTDDLFVDDETYDLKPLKSVVLQDNKGKTEFELKNPPQLAAVADPLDETKPFMIHLDDGSEIEWLAVNFELGNKIK